MVPRTRPTTLPAIKSEGNVQGRGNDFVTDAVYLDGVDHRPGPCFATRGAGHQRGQFAAELNFGFREERAHGLEPRGSFFGGLRGVDDPHALAVVAAAGHLEDNGPTGFFAEDHERGDVSDGSPGGVRESHSVDGSPHHQFVLGINEGVGARLDVHAGGQKRAEVVRGYVFVVERHDIQAVREVEESLEVLVVTNRRSGHSRYG